MSIKETYKHMRDLLSHICTDLEKAEGGNKAASQRVRTGTVKLEKIAKRFRKESIASEKTKGPKKGASKSSGSKGSSKSSSQAKKSSSSSSSKGKSSASSKSKSSAPVKSKPKAASARASFKPRQLSVKRATAKLPTRRSRR